MRLNAYNIAVEGAVPSRWTYIYIPLPAELDLVLRSPDLMVQLHPEGFPFVEAIKMKVNILNNKKNLAQTLDTFVVRK